MMMMKKWKIVSGALLLAGTLVALLSSTVLAEQPEAPGEVLPTEASANAAGPPCTTQAWCMLL